MEHLQLDFGMINNADGELMKLFITMKSNMYQYLLEENLGNNFRVTTHVAQARGSSFGRHCSRDGVGERCSTSELPHLDIGRK